MEIDGSDAQAAEQPATVGPELQQPENEKPSSALADLETFMAAVAKAFRPTSLAGAEARNPFAAASPADQKPQDEAVSDQQQTPVLALAAPTNTNTDTDTAIDPTAESSAGDDFTTPPPRTSGTTRALDESARTSPTSSEDASAIPRRAPKAQRRSSPHQPVSDCSDEADDAGISGADSAPGSVPPSKPTAAHSYSRRLSMPARPYQERCELGGIESAGDEEEAEDGVVCLSAAPQQPSSSIQRRRRLETQRSMPCKCGHDDSADEEQSADALSTLPPPPVPPRYGDHNTLTRRHTTTVAGTATRLYQVEHRGRVEPTTLRRSTSNSSMPASKALRATQSAPVQYRHVVMGEVKPKTGTSVNPPSQFRPTTLPRSVSMTAPSPVPSFIGGGAPYMHSENAGLMGSCAQSVYSFDTRTLGGTASLCYVPLDMTTGSVQLPVNGVMQQFVLMPVQQQYPAPATVRPVQIFGTSTGPGPSLKANPQQQDHHSAKALKRNFSLRSLIKKSSKKSLAIA